MERPTEGTLPALEGPVPRTVAQTPNPIKNLAGGLLVPRKVVENASLIGAGSSGSV